MQTALNALNSPAAGWVTTYFSWITTPPPSGTSAVATVMPCGAGVGDPLALGLEPPLGLALALGELPAVGPPLVDGAAEAGAEADGPALPPVEQPAIPAPVPIATAASPACLSSLRRLRAPATSWSSWLRTSGITGSLGGRGSVLSSPV
ncbi:hypothetical protein GCM10028864_49440 [Microlunatus parietis]